MVCNRCKMVVQSELENIGLNPVSVELGEAEIEEDTIDGLRDQLLDRLRSLGFDLIDDKRSRIIEKVKTVIIDQVHHHDNDAKNNLSDVLTAELNYDYSYLSKLFSDVEGTTIEKYFIAQKVEKVKELLVYDELSISEIAFRLNYSSVGYLSNQFKRVTGLTPSHFRQIGENKRKTLDEV
jgi:AraC-like DNA-binding protein